MLYMRNSQLEKLKAFYLVLFSFFFSMGGNLNAQMVTEVVASKDNPWWGFGYNQYLLDRKPDGSDLTPWDGGHWQVTEERIRAIRPGFVRAPLYRRWFNPSGVTGVYDWDSPEMQDVYKSYDLYKEMDVFVLGGLWGVSQNSNQTSSEYLASDDCVQMLADVIYHFYVTKGYTNMRAFTPCNEPKGVNYTWQSWSTCIKKLYAKCQQMGLPDTILCGSDSWDERVEYTARDNKDQLGTYDFHAYTSGELPAFLENGIYNHFVNMLGLIKKQDDSGKPVLVTEGAATNVSWIDYPNQAGALLTVYDYHYGTLMVDYAIQSLRSGVSSVLAWGLDGFDQGKDPGMWNISGKNGGIKLRPWYYTWSLLCRSFPREATILEMSQPENRKVKVSGAMIKEGEATDWSFALVNRDIYSNRVILKMPEVNTTTQFYIYTYSETTQGNGRDLSLPYQKVTVDNPAGGFSVKIPADGAVILSTLSPLNEVSKPDTDLLNVDFENDREINYSVVPVSGSRDSKAVCADNPRKREPNTSERVLEIKHVADNTGSLDNNLFAACFTPDNEINITSAAPYFSYHVLRTDYATQVGIVFTLDTDEQICYYVEIERARSWLGGNLDLSGFTGRKIKNILFYPNRRFTSENAGSAEYTYFDDFKLSADATNVLAPSEVIPSYDDSEETLDTYITFETDKENYSYALEMGNDNCEVRTVDNPRKNDENMSSRCCVVAQAYGAFTGNEGKDMTASVTPFRYFKIIAGRPFLNFQVMRPTDAVAFELEVVFSDGTIEKENLNMAERRVWENHSVDLTAHAGKAIKSIRIKPNPTFENIPGAFEYSYYDNFRLSEKDQGATSVRTFGRSNVKIYASVGKIIIEGAEGKNAVVYTLDGMSVYAGRIAGRIASISLSEGFYIVACEELRVKIRL